MVMPCYGPQRRITAYILNSTGNWETLSDQDSREKLSKGNEKKDIKCWHSKLITLTQIAKNKMVCMDLHIIGTSESGSIRGGN
jgi:hypothetical protein